MTEHYAYLLNKLSKDIEQFAPESKLASASLDTSSSYLNLTLIGLGVLVILYLMYNL